MLRDERDYILRMIAAAAAAVARLREKLVGGGSPDEVVQEARAAQTELLGGGRDAALLRLLDPRSAVHTLGDPQRLEQWRDLLRVEAEALRAAGRHAEAIALEARIAAMSQAPS
jgi:hypothetical protein